MTSPVLRRDTDDGVTTLVLNRPEKRNALAAAMVEELLRLLAEAGADPDVRVIALCGSGRDFCAGADLGEIAASQSKGPEAGLADAQRLGEVFLTIRRLPQPVVAVVQGRALGGGCGLATACDLVVAHEDASLGYPEVHLGFVPALVMSILKRKVGDSAAFELLLRGRGITARESASIGLVNQVIPGERFESTVEEYLAALATRPATAVALTKRLFYGLDGVSIEDAVARGAEVNALARFTEDCKRGVASFLVRSRSR